ncbi:MAG: hypothetical protein ACI90V_014315, partial [Bacillariaceae sp.]
TFGRELKFGSGTEVSEVARKFPGNIRQSSGPLLVTSVPIPFPSFAVSKIPKSQQRTTCRHRTSKDQQSYFYVLAYYSIIEQK